MARDSSRTSQAAPLPGNNLGAIYRCGRRGLHLPFLALQERLSGCRRYPSTQPHVKEPSVLVQSWLQVPYIEHSSKSAGRGQKCGHLQCNEGSEVGALRPHQWGCPSLWLLWRTIWQHLSQGEMCKLHHLASPDLELVPRETPPHAHVTHSFRKRLFEDLLDARYRPRL